MKKEVITLTLSAIALTVLASCGNNNSSKSQSTSADMASMPLLESCAIHHDDEFGGAYIDISIADFNALGFSFGDSVSITFVSGKDSITFDDIGYYSGYYVPAGQDLLVGYKGYDYIKYCINYGEDIYAANGFDTNTKVTVSLKEAGKYLGVEETLSISYSDDKASYPSDEAFANFREVKVGNIKPGRLYRGASPLDDTRKRASTVSSLLKKNGIAYNIDLADKKENIATQSKYVISEYMQSLIDNDKCIFLGMAAAYKAEEFSVKMKTMFEAILNNEGPYYLHCLEGKDRTGYVCMVIEALCGATYEELVEDYFITYSNYYGIEKGSKKYETIKEIHIDEMIRYVFSFDEKTGLFGAGYYSKARAYLASIGLSESQIDALQEKFSD
ncbi:MAG: tyrosine-protein phosphatase [Bacilli bacterium]|nr:tyrosine-protein phosphatase [Bacilli bacterium]